MTNLRSHREALRISQSKLARLSKVSRFKICTYELGDCELTATEQGQIQDALQAEAQRIRGITYQVDFGHFESRHTGANSD